MKFRLNEDITCDRIMLIDHNGQKVGLVSISEGIAQAKQHDLDLVEIASNSSTPVCKILDFGKYKYDLVKKSHTDKKKQKTTAIKEIKMRPHIEDYDFEVKLKNAKRFIDKSNKVKVSLFFRGREMKYDSIGYDMIKKFKDKASDFASVEVDVKREGRHIYILLVPKND